MIRILDNQVEEYNSLNPNIRSAIRRRGQRQKKQILMKSERAAAPFTEKMEADGERKKDKTEEET